MTKESVGVQQADAVLGAALKQFRSATRNPEIYLQAQEKRAQKHAELVKQLYDFAKTAADNRSTYVPDELVVEDMDAEQIWQQIELQNEFLWGRCLKLSGKLLSGRDEAFRLQYTVAGEEPEDDDDDSADEEESVEEEESELGSEDEHEESDDGGKRTSKASRKHAGRKSIVDDQFFKLSEMEEFLEAEDRREMQKNSQRRPRKDAADEDIDYFQADDEEDADNYNYKDFYDGSADEDDDDEDGEDDDGLDDRARMLKMVEQKNRTKLKQKKADLGLEDSEAEEADEEEEDDGEEDDDDEDEDEKADGSGGVKFDLSKNQYRSDSGSDDDEDAAAFKSTGSVPLTDEERSTHEHRLERLRLQIDDMEEAALGEKVWQLRGEINSDSRPQNSLLEEVLEFDSTVRPAPVITEETTLRLEDIIRQRIKDKAWNDVERKFKPVDAPQEYRKKLVLDQEKSKESLAQIYEKEYLKEVDKLKPNGGDATGDAADEPKEHTEIRTLMKDVFAQLDALANFYYTPKVAQAEVRIITNIPAISMEEVAPVSVSDAALLAPEEVRPRDKGAAIGKTERSQTDKNRERRQKKQKQRELGRAKERKEAEKAAKGIVSSSKADQKKLLAKVSKSRNVIKSKDAGDGKSIKSSTKFFSQLQDEVRTTASAVKGKASKSKRKTIDANQANAKRFKM